MIYPLMVLGAITGLIILLATVVFPQFATVLNQSKGPVPIPTQILFFLSTVFRLYWWVLLGAIAARDFGAANRDTVVAAWRHFSQAISTVPDTGPNMGTNNAIGNPLFFQEPPVV